MSSLSYGCAGHVERLVLYKAASTSQVQRLALYRAASTSQVQRLALYRAASIGHVQRLAAFCIAVRIDFPEKNKTVFLVCSFVVTTSSNSLILVLSKVTEGDLN